LLLHHTEDEIRINAVARAVLFDQRIEPRATCRPTPLTLRALVVFRIGDCVRLLTLDPFDARALNEDRETAALVPDAISRLVHVVNLETRAADQVDQDRLMRRIG